jgi:Flp pilus assembly protein TadB
MKKSIEERLADIESNITRLTKMQNCVFNLLQAQHKISTFMSETEWSMSSLKQSVESVSQNEDYSLRFMFGALTAMGIALSMTVVYSTTEDFVAGILSLMSFALAVVLFFLSVRYDRRVRSQRKTFFQKEWPEAQEQTQRVKEEAAALDDALAQVVAEWKKLIPDDLASEPKSED